MCKNHNPRVIDKCMRKILYNLKCLGVQTKACCCGHGKYPMTIVAKNKCWGYNIEIFSGIVIPRTKRFYKKDDEGYYYIPEISKS